MPFFISSDSVKAACCALLLAGCSSGGGGILSGGEVGEIPSNAAERGGAVDAGAAGALDGQSIRKTLLGDGIDDNRLPVNKYLWSASLDVLDFLPLASIDTFSGVIATDWGASPEAPNERVRVTARVKDAELTASALDVSVFRETLNAGGAWQSAVVSPQTADALEDAILTRARQLRIADVDG